MIRKTIQILLLSTFLAAFSYAEQSISISGVVSDKNTGERLMFVNIGLEGTLTGTASNAMGEFILRIPADQANKNLYFSAIGYKNQSLPLTSFVVNDTVYIQLEPLTYGLDDVEVTSESRVMYRLVRNAARAAKTHFINSAYSCNAIYSNEYYTNNIGGNKREALVNITDATGYGKKSNAYIARNYKIENVKRNFNVEGLKEGTTSIDELLSLDLLRTPMNISDTVYLNEYDLEMLDSEKINEDSVWVIAFKHSKPELSRTGDFYASSYQGKLFISKQNNVLLKAEGHISGSQQSPYGRTLATEPDRAPANVEYHFSISYKKSKHGYISDRISLDKSFMDKSGEKIRKVASLLFFDEPDLNPELLTNRQYFENMISDPDFWTHFKK
jgi:hypothetical protein